MTSIIENLFFGNINPNLAVSIDSEHYREAVSAVNRTEALLTDMLSGQEKQLFPDMVNAISTTGGTESVSHFSNGFRLGARLMLEMLSQTEKYLPD